MSTSASTSTSDTGSESTLSTTTPIFEDLPATDEPLVLIDFLDLAAPFANHGALGGEATCEVPRCPYISDRVGLAWFDGFDDCLEIAHHDALASASGTTIAMWIRRDEDPPSGSISTAIGKPLGDEGPNSWAIYWGATEPNGVQARGAVNSVRGETSVVSHVVNAGAYAHVALTHDGTTLSMYVNGELVDSEAGPGIGFDDSSIFIGCDVENGAPAFHMTGQISDVRVYARVLSQDEIVDFLNPFD